MKLVKKQYSHNIEIIESSDLEIDRSLDSFLLRQEVGFYPASWPKLIEKMNDEYNKFFR